MFSGLIASEKIPRSRMNKRTTISTVKIAAGPRIRPEVKIPQERRGENYLIFG